MSVCDSHACQRRAVLRAALAAPLAGVLHSPGALAASYSADAMLATPWQPRLNPADYLVSEKLDGVRALWDGHTLRFRSGRPIAAPAWFVAGLPALALDGELWAGRRSFERLSGTVRKDLPVDAEWQALRYMVFDLPRDARPFALRARHIPELTAAADQPWLQALAQSTVPDAAALQTRLNEVVAAGGEGLVFYRQTFLLCQLKVLMSTFIRRLSSKHKNKEIHLHMLDQSRQSQCSNPAIGYAALAPLLVRLIV